MGHNSDRDNMSVERSPEAAEAGTLHGAESISIVFPAAVN